MEFQEFCKKIYKGVTQMLGEEVTVALEKIQKNNGVVLSSLLISEEGAGVEPAIYLDGYYADYKKGRDAGAIIMEIVHIYRQVCRKEKVDMDFFQEYENVRDRICFKLIHFHKNKELLEKVPYLPYLNLAVVFYYAFDSRQLGKGTILIRNSHLKGWGISIKELYKDAAVNTGKLFPPELISMKDLVEDFLNPEEEEVGEEELIPMYVLTNSSRQFGAAAMLYTEHLEKLADKMDKNLFILPSSIHEVILLPDCGERAYNLKAMVEEVNETQVAQEEILADSVYYYDRDLNNIRQLA